VAEGVEEGGVERGLGAKLTRRRVKVRRGVGGGGRGGGVGEAEEEDSARRGLQLGCCREGAVVWACVGGGRTCSPGSPISPMR